MIDIQSDQIQVSKENVSSTAGVTLVMHQIRNWNWIKFIYNRILCDFIMLMDKLGINSDFTANEAYFWFLI